MKVITRVACAAFGAAHILLRGSTHLDLMTWIASDSCVLPEQLSKCYLVLLKQQVIDKGKPISWVMSRVDSIFR